MTQQRLRFRDPNEDPHSAGVTRIVCVAARQGFTILRSDAKKAWTAYSESMAAGWMHMPEDDRELWALIEHYFQPDDD